MDYFKNLTAGDLLAIQDMDTHQLNDYQSAHHYAICSGCGKEMLFQDRPILKESVWKKILDFYGAAEHYSHEPVQGYKVGSPEAKLNRVNMLLTIRPESVVICPHCMENALGRKLTMDDYVDCGYTRDYLKKYNV